ncbi:hypothetical protein VTI28DRAFT_9791 [Corynascus sepedonium]
MNNRRNDNAGQQLISYVQVLHTRTVYRDTHIPAVIFCYKILQRFSSPWSTISALPTVKKNSVRGLSLAPNGRLRKVQTSLCAIERSSNLGRGAVTITARR